MKLARTVVVAIGVVFFLMLFVKYRGGREMFSAEEREIISGLVASRVTVATPETRYVRVFWDRYLGMKGFLSPTRDTYARQSFVYFVASLRSTLDSLFEEQDIYVEFYFLQEDILQSQERDFWGAVADPDGYRVVVRDLAGALSADPSAGEIALLVTDAEDSSCPDGLGGLGRGLSDAEEPIRSLLLRGGSFMLAGFRAPFDGEICRGQWAHYSSFEESQASPVVRETWRPFYLIGVGDESEILEILEGLASRYRSRDQMIVRPISDNTPVELSMSRQLFIEEPSLGSPEVIFVGWGSGSPPAFIDLQLETKGLQVPFVDFEVKGRVKKFVFTRGASRALVLDELDEVSGKVTAQDHGVSMRIPIGRPESGDLVVYKISFFIDSFQLPAWLMKCATADAVGAGNRTYGLLGSLEDVLSEYYRQVPIATYLVALKR